MDMGMLLHVYTIVSSNQIKLYHVLVT